jgi:phenylalanine-4-hydroxylase
MNKILRMLKGKFKFIDKLCPQQFLVFLNLLYLNSRKLSNFREVVSVNNLHIIDSSVMIPDHNLCEFKVS